MDGLAERTITVGSVSKEYRMIGWRVGWVAGPGPVMDRIGLVSIYNVVTPVGLSQPGALAALTDPAGAGVAQAVTEWETEVRHGPGRALRPPVHPRATAAGRCCWTRAGSASTGRRRRGMLLEKGKVAATPMTHWGEENAGQFVRLVFSNEPVARLEGLGDRVRRALAG